MKTRNDAYAGTGHLEPPSPRPQPLAPEPLAPEPLAPEPLAPEPLGVAKDPVAARGVQVGFHRPLSFLAESSGPAEASRLEPAGEEDWGVVAKAPTVDPTTLGYSIQIPHPQRRLVCPRCGTLFLAAGPTGHDAGQPICDLCLLEGSNELGLLLALASAARIFGAFETEDAEEYEHALADYGAFARIYELVAVRSGPPRLFPSTVS